MKKDSMEDLSKTKKAIAAPFSSLSNSTPIDIEPGLILLDSYKVIHRLGKLPNVHARSHQTMGQNEERIYEEELRKNGKLNKDLGADR